ncbi:unnamed protein product, partial [Musa hybrid cultivar]
MVLNCLLVYVFLSENVQTNALYAIRRDEGMRGLYKGLGPVL